MCPPGLSFVWAGEKAIAAFDRLKSIGVPRVGYLDWERRLDPQGFYDTYAGTPPSSHLFALDVALDLLEEQGGLEAVWERHRVLASCVHAAVGAWTHDEGVSMNIASERHRSNAVTTVLTGEQNSKDIARLTQQMSEVTLGIGMAYDATGSFRFGHMGNLNAAMVLGTLGATEAALHALSIPITDSGVAAASRVLATEFLEETPAR